MIKAALIWVVLAFVIGLIVFGESPSKRLEMPLLSNDLGKELAGLSARLYYANVYAITLVLTGGVDNYTDNLSADGIAYPVRMDKARLGGAAGHHGL